MSRRRTPPSEIGQPGLSRKVLIAHQFAALILGGDWTARAIETCLEGQLGPKRKPMYARVANELIKACPTAYAPTPQWLADALMKSADFRKAIRALERRGKVQSLVLKAPMFQPAAPFAALDVPALSTPAYLADWLGVSVDALDWLADAKQQHGAVTIGVLRHYHYSWAAKRSGGWRLIEAPKDKLKAAQRKILEEILNRAPVSAHAHGFVRGRSCIGAARIHAGEHVVVALDLRNFFPGVGAGRVQGLFRLLGYPWAVARLLAGLCTTRTPMSVFDGAPEPARHDWELRHLYGAPHLAQGAPTSPAITNLLAWRLDQRLAGLARAAGANYSRYADDMAFSGDGAFATNLGPFLRGVDKIVREEGFIPNVRKTRVMRRGARQSFTGVVVNEHVNVPRSSYDALKATLYNCVRNGPGAENRQGLADFRAHLDGRIAWVEALNPVRAMKLRRLFDAIAW